MPQLDTETFDRLLEDESCFSSPLENSLMLVKPSARSSVSNLGEGLHQTLTENGDQDDTDPDLEEMKKNAALRAHGYEGALRKSFSPLAALGLGFRRVDPAMIKSIKGLIIASAASRTLGSDTSAVLARTWLMEVPRAWCLGSWWLVSLSGLFPLGSPRLPLVFLRPV